MAPTINGIIRVNKQELKKLKNQDAIVSSELFGKADGMFDPQYVGATKLHKLRSGKIAINTISGISILDPSIMNNDKTHYSLMVKSITTGTDSYYSNQEDIKISSSLRHIQINYSFIDFIHPDKVEFQYLLEPFDSEWQIAGNDRFVKYTNLPPGEYIFKLKAFIKSKSNTVLDEEISFTITPAFYETILFKILIIIVVLLLVCFLYIVRVKTIKHQKDLLEREVFERTSEITKQKEAILDHMKQL